MLKRKKHEHYYGCNHWNPAGKYWFKRCFTCGHIYRWQSIMRYDVYKCVKCGTMEHTPSGKTVDGCVKCWSKQKLTFTYPPPLIPDGASLDEEKATFIDVEHKTWSWLSKKPLMP